MNLMTQRLALSASLILLLTACGGGSGDDDGSGGDGGSGNITGKTIASIDEASGICYSEAQDALFVVSDKGVVYKLDMEGNIQEEQAHRSAKDKKYDYEGVACDDDNEKLVVAVEGKDNLHTIDQNDISFLSMNDEGKPTGDITRPDDDTLFKDEEGKTGIEGVSMNEGTIYVSNQSLVKYPGQDSSFVFTVDDYTADAPNVDTVIDHGQLDIVGLSFHQGSLFMISATNHKLLEYDLDSEKVVSTKDLPTGIDAEGVTFDNDGNIYFADDKNGKVYQYKASDFGVN